MLISNQNSRMKVTVNFISVAFGQEPGQELVAWPHWLKAFCLQPMAPWEAGKFNFKNY